MNNPQESVDQSKSIDYRTIEQTMESFLAEQEDLQLNLQLLRALILCGMF